MHLFAGMPSFHLTDIARLRIENISFFLAGFLVCALLLKLLWNYLATDWTFLPRLSYGKAVGLAALWGLLSALVLTMISGARELMTPGAWEKKGATYQLVDEARSKRPQERRERLELLKAALWKYADAHEGRFPPTQADPEIEAILWKAPDPSGMTYLYIAGRDRTASAAAPLAFEPDLFGGDRLVLCVDGVIRTMTSDGITQALAEKQ